MSTWAWAAPENSLIAENEGVAGRGVALHDAAGVGHVAGPHPTAPAVLREADFLGMTKAVLRVQEHPEGDRSLRGGFASLSREGGDPRPRC